MKYFLLICCLGYLSGCSSYRPLSKDNIKAVHVLFKDRGWGHHAGYKLYDGSIATWDKKNIGVKAALNNHQNKRSLLKKEGSDYLAPLFVNKKNFRYTPIKVTPLKEFGYIEMNSNQLIFYGIMGNTFIDLTNDKVYH
ncbi:hypothetical protein [Pedobacter hiemivivus]|uniref:Uncharacterized protein n=1 Tax=Pedobacter hiemivivus TaxID=2530454 RepID=A0A4R0NAC2_9SPHI|nr:hypothetical protein [Pedobacter hiemivivus]TCC97181.1 hypothetical protein EZ444_10045 [Pedobacter hiemivivus]